NALSVDYSDKIAAQLLSNGLPVAGKTVTFTVGGANVGSAVTDANGYATPTFQNGYQAGSAGNIVATFAGDPDFFGSTRTVAGTSTQEDLIISGSWQQAGGSNNYKITPVVTEIDDTAIVGGALGNVSNVTVTIQIRVQSAAGVWGNCGGPMTATPTGTPASFTFPTQNCTSAGGRGYQISLVTPNNYYQAALKSGVFPPGSGGVGPLSVPSTTGTSGGTTTLSAGTSSTSPMGTFSASAAQPVLLASVSGDAGPVMTRLARNLTTTAADSGKGGGDQGGEGKEPPPGLVGQPIEFFVNDVSVGQALIGEDGFARLDYHIDLPAGTYTVTALFKGHAEMGPQKGEGTLTVSTRSGSLTYAGDMKDTGGEFRLAATLKDNSGTGFDLTRAGSAEFHVKDSGGKELANFTAPVNADGLAELKVPNLTAGAAQLEVRLASNGYFEAEPITISLTGATTMSLKDAAGQYSDPVSLEATVGAAAAGGSVTFTVDGRDAGTATVDAQGVATVRYLITEGAGTYNIAASFSGDGKQLTPAAAAATLTVTPEASTLAYTGDTKVSKGPARLAAQVTQQADDTPGDLIKATVRFDVLRKDGTVLANFTAAVSADGTAEVTVPELPAEAAQVNVSLVAGGYFEAASVSAAITGPTPDPTPGDMAVADATVQYSDAVTLQATVVAQAAGGSVQFMVGSRIAGKATVDKQGIAKLRSVITEAPGTYEIKASFTAKGARTPEQTATGTLTVAAETATLAYTGDRQASRGVVFLAARVTQEADGSSALLTPAKLRFDVTTEDGTTTSYEVSVKSDGTASYRLQAAPVGQLSVTVGLLSDRFTATPVTVPITGAAPPPPPPKPTASVIAITVGTRPGYVISNTYRLSGAEGYVQITYTVYRTEGGKKVAVDTFSAWATPGKQSVGSHIVRTTWNTADLKAGVYTIEAEVAVGSAPDSLTTAGRKQTTFTVK
ncbi:MAG: conserved repeat domain protein, partial [Firmicutes bacterium]|nr:conserved repeat domain protein [Bacillota bacterium]